MTPPTMITEQLTTLVCFLPLVLLGSAAQQKSSIIVETDDGVQGPVIELSASILTDSQSLRWVCRENTEIETNTFDRKEVNTADSWVTVGDVRKPGSGTFRGCSNDYMCSEISGTLRWSKEMGGTYRCSAYPKEQFNVIWLNPSVTVSGEGEYDLGETVEFFCEVEMTPADISYAGIMTVQWLRYNHRAYGSQWKPVEETENTKLITPQQGSRYSLKIKDFSGIRDGGDYKCLANIEGHSEPIRSEEIAVTSGATSLLINDRSNTFEFGEGEQNVIISCLVDSYPYPSEIKITIGGTDVGRINNPQWSVEADLYTPVEGKLVSKVTLFNVTAEFNDSLVECRVKREGFQDYEGRHQETMFVFKNVPKDREYTPPGQEEDGTSYTGPGRPQQKTIETWIVVLVVILSLVVLLIVILIFIWRYRAKRNSGFLPGRTEDPDDGVDD